MMKLPITQANELVILLRLIESGYSELARIWTIKLVRMVK